MERSPSEIRMDLARGHWALGERDDAIFCLERVVQDDPATSSLLELAESFLAELAGDRDHLLLTDRLNELCRRVIDADVRRPPEERSNLSTATLAELLERQGHTEHAIEVADDVLRRDPADERARAVRGRLLAQADPAPPDSRRAQLAELERWLESLRRREPRGGAPTRAGRA